MGNNHQKFSRHSSILNRDFTKNLVMGNNTLATGDGNTTGASHFIIVIISILVPILLLVLICCCIVYLDKKTEEKITDKV